MPAPAPARTPAALLLLPLALLLAGPAAAQVPSSDANVDLFTLYGEDVGTSHAGPGGSDLLDSSSVARGEVDLPGALRSYAKTGGVDGTEDLEAASNAVQVTRWTALGPADSPIDVDISLSVSGSLRLIDFAGANPGDMEAAASLDVAVVTAAQAMPVYDASAFLLEGSDLMAFGDWMGEFSCVGTSDEICSIDATTVLSDVALVSDGEDFAVVVDLLTEALAVRAAEIFAEADFFDTVSFELSSSTPGASFVFVPEPGTAALLALGLLAAGLGARRP